ncbi:MAG: protease modulator HflC [Methylococcales bacterium]|nr:protease modulator HflC [Methylococcales bacterium]
MMSNKILVGLGLVMFVFMSCVFTVHETQKAIKFQLGEIIKADYTPGLYFKFPFVNNVKKFDTRILTLDSKPERFLTSEKKNVIVDTFVKWRIIDVSKFYTSVAGDAVQANLRIDQIIKDAARSEFSSRTIKYLVRTEREAIRDALIITAAPQAIKLGIELIDIRVKRIDLPPQVSKSVYSRMDAERKRVAHELRSEGKETSEGIRANADKQREVILANAYREAEKTKGEGDAQSADIFAQAYGKDVEFFQFLRSMSAYEKTFRRQGDMLVVEPDSDFFKYFKKQK